MAAERERIRRAVAARADALKALALAIHREPELGYREVKACARQVDLLSANGFRVRTPVAGIPTAYRAEFGSGRPAIAYCSEYDALPEIGHGCGHNLIAACAVGAGLALSRLLADGRVTGSVVILGTPAEESKGGKVRMLRAGAFEGIDGALMGHPYWRSSLDSGSSAITRFKVAFEGQAAHAAASPELGRNALDAVMLLFQGINAWRQQLPSGTRIHGVVDKGGTVPNVIPDRCECTFFLRAEKDEVLGAMVTRFRALVRGAGLMTDTKPRLSGWMTPYRARRVNGPFNEAFGEAAKKAGLEPVRPTRVSMGSSDFGDVSQVMPGCHPYFGIATREIPIHSPQFTEAAATPYALSHMLKMAETLAMLGARFLSEPDFRKRVRTAFEGAEGG